MEGLLQKLHLHAPQHSRWTEVVRVKAEPLQASPGTPTWKFSALARALQENEKTHQTKSFKENSASPILNQLALNLGNTGKGC